MPRSIILLIAIFLGIGLSCASAQSPGPKRDGKPSYETREKHDPDGIGKFYMGREIAWVMGHQAAAWLERPDREETELPQRVVVEMDLKPSDVVADIGAGTGYFTFRISPLVPQGKVFAVDIQPEMLAIIEERRDRFKAKNVVTLLGTEQDTRLPSESVDAVLMVDAYHEFSYPVEMIASIFKALKPGGRVILIEYRGEDPDVPIKKLHKMTVDQARNEMEAAGLRWSRKKDFLPDQHFMIFEKPLNR